ncbi:hypothetical protein DUNSADRAFT_10348 [Dunaliella salina]|uniref:Plastid lipid-associated protein/fibrillin conserved domain-containing protein n=1 Tax=Dunaliella salina TaxID=3046 RepID=A0ABQ7H4Y1_DUNSA|nr:hypothetical protein DUNSADRAFT_10348 [Dunaliella salina]|eukprot:KAF5841911.1 hypothetical protein DUNSADRAFT_10348 [Dunaliella salina]
MLGIRSTHITPQRCVRTHVAASPTRSLMPARRTTTSPMPPRKPPQERSRLEQQVIDIVSSAKGRAKLSPDQLEELVSAVDVLEQMGGTPAPTKDAALDGKWKLLFTSSPGTNSPIQRTFTGVESFSIFQEVSLQEDEEARVNNCVDFGPKVGFLRVEAQASIESRPLPGFTPRAGSGESFFGGLLGKSSTEPPARPNSRIDFQFDKAAFYFRFLPFSIPYPVPFRILGDERKGWLDVTYMSEDRMFRLSRGNKGTLFILQKDVPLKDRLLDALSQNTDDDKVMSLLTTLVKENPTSAPARSPKAGGTWRLIWSQQSSDASPLQKWGSKQAKSYQVINEDGSLRNIVDLGSWLRLTALATCEPASATRTTVSISQAGLMFGEGKWDKPWFFQLSGPRQTKDGEPEPPGWVEWLYLDDDLRVTQGSKGSLFVHRREQDS